MDSTASFGYWLRRRRKARDLTQAALARQVGCAVVTIRKIEADAIRPSRQIAEKLAEILAIPPEERAGFLKVARAALSPDQLALPTEPVERTLVDHLADAAAVALLPTDQQSLPSGTLTFLFTDIEGSTTLWEQHPTAMRVALARHNSILRAAVEAHAGAIFKTVGDAVCAAFASAPAALTTALDAQHAMVAEDWGVIGVLRVRMALHTGTAETRGGDYIGPPLNRIARLVAAAHGGQVLLSRATQELVRDELPQGVALRDLGEHRLKDLTRPEHIFQLVAADLPADFPPLTTLASHPTNLPVQPTPLIGREQEVEQLCALLRRRDVRMATLTGPGGSGKTRLALQAAAELLEEFTHGVWFVDLAPIGDPGLVVATIAQAIGVHQAGSQPLLKTLQTYLREKQMLLLLDNFEQVLEAAPHVTRLLAAAPDVKTLVTSRAPLHLSGEHEFVVPPLALPARKHVPRFEQLTQYDAVRLFIERAQAARADFVVTNENAPAVAEICHRLDGLPLAIELAAARIKLFTPQALLARLGSRLKLLTGGARDLPARQQTLRSTIDWSYNLLSAANQTLFARLAVFVGGCTLEAADGVCNADGTFEDTLDELAGLLDQSLLRDVEGPDGEPRFVLLETIREYALERLTLSGAREALQTQHADYYLMLAEAAESELRRPRQMAWLNRLDAEHDNCRAALSWALEQGDGETLARLSAALGWFWYVSGQVSEGRRWFTAALAHGSTLPASLRARALKEAGELTRAQGNYEQAIALFEESLALYQGLGDKRGSANALISLGHTIWRQCDFARARVLSEESLTLFREMEDLWGIAKSLNYLGNILVETGDFEQARAAHEQSLALRREIGHIWGIAVSLDNLGWVAVEQGDYMRAAPLFAESLTLFQELGDKRVIWDLLDGMARVAEGQGHSLRAARLYGAEENVRATIGLPIVHSSYRTKYERSVAAVRVQLDEATFAAAWAEGRAMTLEEAIEEALRDS